MFKSALSQARQSRDRRGYAPALFTDPLERFGLRGVYFDANDNGGNPPSPAGDPPAGDPPNPAGDPPKTYTQADLDRIAAKTRQEEREKAQRQAEADKKRADEEQLKVQGEWKTVAEGHERTIAQKDARIAELESLLEQKEVDVIRADVANEKKLTAWEASRLQGKTREELMADADTAIAARPVPGTPNLNNGNGNGGGGGGKITITDEQRNKAAREIAHSF